MFSICAVIPYLNNSETIARTIDSLRNQTYPLTEILLIDDGSAFLPHWLSNQEDIRLISFPVTRGRGSVRAFAMEQGNTDLILFCDASIILPRSFVAEAVVWLNSPQIAAAFGRIRQEHNHNLSDRWRGRHLFKEKASVAVSHNALLATGGCLIRRSAALESGNFNPLHIHSEDADLGRRLLENGFDVVFDPSLYAVCIVSNTIPQVLERYWRWHAGPKEGINLIGYLRHILFSLKVMVLQDLSDKDLLSVPISLLVPHYQLWKSWRERQLKKAARRF